MSVKSSTHLYIERWGEMMGSNPSYVADEVKAAAKDKAPATAIYRTKGGKWWTIEEVTSFHTRHYFTARGWMTPEWTVPQ